MENWKAVNLSKEEEEGIVWEEEDSYGEDLFRRTLAGKLWTDSPFNVRAFKQTMIQAWRLKNQVEVEDLKKNLFLFWFATKKDADLVLKNGPWSFDRNLLILNRVSGDEQPADLEMNKVAFWVRVYELPLKVRSDSMAKKLGNIIGQFEETDPLERNRTGRFLRLKVLIDLRKPLKRGTVIKSQDRSLKVYFKYERLPNFCFVCGRIGHQLKECDEAGDLEEAGYEDLEEKELGFGPWLRASPLPKPSFEPRKESSSGACSKNLFESTSTSKNDGSGKGTEVEVEQQKKPSQEETPKTVVVLNVREITSKEVESVAESLGTVALSQTFDMGQPDNSKGKNSGQATSGEVVLENQHRLAQ
ncbi:hypothetical protein P8452_28938 [Trifolium repens]|nr:hypothetical protein P8452_28938 [Trifolium repens]